MKDELKQYCLMLSVSGRYFLVGIMSFQYGGHNDVLDIVESFEISSKSMTLIFLVVAMEIGWIWTKKVHLLLYQIKIRTIWKDESHIIFGGSLTWCV